MRGGERVGGSGGEEKRLRGEWGGREGGPNSDLEDISEPDEKGELGRQGKEEKKEGEVEEVEKEMRKDVDGVVEGYKRECGLKRGEQTQGG